MAVLGLGTDIVEIARIAAIAAQREAAFAKRLLTEAEHAQWEKTNAKAAFLAKRFAVKEAAAKALGTGIASGVSLQDFSLSHDEKGKPLLNLSGKAAELATALGVQHIWVTLADERDYAVATVLLES